MVALAFRRVRRRSTFGSPPSPGRKERRVGKGDVGERPRVERTTSRCRARSSGAIDDEAAVGRKGARGDIQWVGGRRQGKRDGASTPAAKRPGDERGGSRRQPALPIATRVRRWPWCGEYDQLGGRRRNHVVNRQPDASRRIATSLAILFQTPSQQLTNLDERGGSALDMVWLRLASSNGEVSATVGRRRRCAAGEIRTHEPDPRPVATDRASAQGIIRLRSMVVLDSTCLLGDVREGEVPVVSPWSR